MTQDKVANTHWGRAGSSTRSLLVLFLLKAMPIVLQGRGYRNEGLQKNLPHHVEMEQLMI
ncbi:hypothetical protein E2C01_068750 [Portunus trituberculatus]|uniref:Uncharacterized protein n=1 Tax=Portunus trituberculatus TaxID=210409 RepID=A0A5B7HSU5_PORTR|nr:hypothetical protein [Portunus trituberculatus]